MEIIVYIDENGTQEGDCEYRTIELCDKDEQNLFVMIGHFLANGNKFEKVEVLTEKEYQELLAYKYSHPGYIKYKEAQKYVKRHNEKYGSD